MPVVPALSVQGTIRLGDDVMVTFLIDLETGGYSQWGAPTEALGKTQPYVEAMAAGLIEAELIDEEEEEDEEPVTPCVECGEETDGEPSEPGYRFRDGTVMCQSCTHNAYRSGWNGEGSD
jgi:hypothetical protein